MYFGHHCLCLSCTLAIVYPHVRTSKNHLPQPAPSCTGQHHFAYLRPLGWLSRGRHTLTGTIMKWMAYRCPCSSTKRVVVHFHDCFRECILKFHSIHGVLGSWSSQNFLHEYSPVPLLLHVARAAMARLPPSPAQQPGQTRLSGSAT